MGTLTSKIFRIVAMTMAFAMVIVMAGCVQKPPAMEEKTVTVTIQNRAGTPLEKCKVVVYADESLSSVVNTGITDQNGQISFTALDISKYVAVVSKQPTGYAVEKSYALAGERTDIVLKPGVMTASDLDQLQYSLGDAVMDFSVTTPDGNTLFLSELLQQKKAVVLNFWFLNCQPCKMEFPYIQQGYEQVSGEVAVLALNPYDGSDAEVEAFRTDNGYTFTMAKCDQRWEKAMNISAYPTTVVIDRYGNICLVHHGMITETQTFLDMVSYFTAEDYEQVFFRSVGQIPTKAEN
jgi:thiol-disulfide isomerase/thioredoxin